ncbi:hypothetical protein F0231_04120 [Vibrio sp. RE86]|uniref:hypothetical protein n=1 Tax=Vibrio sp. RE86 TaxID=2607605 RepID=UPI001493CA4E|nr:hypothetical protein [Vibrio sp. RE86]NOH78926.1 hypothetical protein [Vibrio sp. RE86]
MNQFHFWQVTHQSFYLEFNGVRLVKASYIDEKSHKHQLKSSHSGFETCDGEQVNITVKERFIQSTTDYVIQKGLAYIFIDESALKTISYTFSPLLGGYIYAETKESLLSQ